MKTHKQTSPVYMQVVMLHVLLQIMPICKHILHYQNRSNKPVEAPNERAFTICPTFCSPPSAITGTPNLRAYSATLYTAVPWGRPTAKTSWKKNNN